jgi:hypothetical protein
MSGQRRFWGLREMARMSGAANVRSSCTMAGLSVLVLMLAGSSVAQYRPPAVRTAAPVSESRPAGVANNSCHGAVDPRAALNVDQCGAYGDNNIHDDTAAFNAALAASKHIVCTANKTYGVRGIISVASSNTTLDLKGCILKLAETPSTNHFLSITVNYTTVNDLHLTGIGNGIGISGGATTTSINRFHCDSALVAAGLSECIYLGAANGVFVDQFRMTSTGYGVLQQSGTTVNNVKISRVTADDMFADFFEQNGTPSGPMSDVTLDRIAFNGCHGFPKPATECRFVGTTSVQGLTISNSQARNGAGDACLHFEGTSAHIQMSNTVLIDCQVGGGNNGYIYFLTSSADFRSTHNTFVKTAKLQGAIFAFTTLSGSYSNPIISIDDTFIDENATHSFGGFDLGFHNGPVTITNPTAKDIGTFISLVSTTGVSWSGGRIINATNGILAANIGQPSGSGGTNISVRGAHIDCLTWCLRSSTNTNGTGPPTNWTLTGNVYTGGGRVLLDGLK